MHPFYDFFIYETGFQNLYQCQINYCVIKSTRLAGMGQCLRGYTSKLFYIIVPRFQQSFAKGDCEYEHGFLARFSNTMC